MKIHSTSLRTRAKSAGVSPDELGASILASGEAREGSTSESLSSAVRNWMSGRDHPRCRPADVGAMARALKCEPKDIARFTSKVRFHRGSPQKAGLIAGLIRGKNATEALNLLQFSPQRAAVNFRKALVAAMADAELAGADQALLVVSESRVDGGPHIKRFHQKDRGRAHQILKRTSHITISVEEKPAPGRRARRSGAR